MIGLALTMIMMMQSPKIETWPRSPVLDSYLMASLSATYAWTDGSPTLKAKYDQAVNAFAIYFIDETSDKRAAAMNAIDAMNREAYKVFKPSTD